MTETAAAVAVEAAGKEWKESLNIPAKDTRVQTAVSFKNII
jgi:hypothetical protein